MIRYLKAGKDVEESAKIDANVRNTVEGILEDIKRDGDAAIRKYSEKFDNWSPECFRLSRAEIDACYAELSESVLDDIKFA